MKTTTQVSERRLSSGVTSFVRDVFPKIWTLGVGAGMAGIWLELFGEPEPMALKLAGVAVWAGTSILFTLTTRSLRDVWLHGSDLVVSSPSESRRVKIPVEDVLEMSETRGQKVKTVKIVLRRGSALGQSIRFIPRHAFQAPFSEHPVIGEIRERKRQLAGDAGSERLAS
jgi:hypothetical protein